MKLKKQLTSETIILTSLLSSQKTDITHIQFVRGLVVGGSAFIVDFSILYFLTEYGGLYYLLSAAIAYVIGTVFNYILSINWIFATRKYASRAKEFSTFMWIGIVGLLLNIIIMWLISEYLLYHYTISKLVSVVIVYFWNFFARKLILFT